MIANSNEPSCEDCHDTGQVVHAGPRLDAVCTCAAGRLVVEQRQRERQAAIERGMRSMFETSGVPREFMASSFETFKERCLDADKRKAFEAAVAVVKEVRRPPPAETDVLESIGRPYPRRGLILCGEYSTGKTGLLTCAYKSLVVSGMRGLWIELHEFFDSVQDGYGDGQARARLRAAMEVPILFLDEIGSTRLLVRGTGPVSSWGTAEETPDRRRILDQLVSYRHREHLPILGTSNLTPGQMSAQFDGRVVERLLQMCRFVTMGGRNLRLKP